MALIKCIECGTLVSEYAEACPKCGCPIDVIKKNVNKKEDSKQVVQDKADIKKIPIQSFDIDVIKIRDDLTHMLEPLTIDFRQTKSVKSEVINYLSSIQDIPYNGLQMIQKPIIDVFDGILERNEYKKAKNSELILTELKKYYSDISENKYNGPGFSIVTNSVASVAAYDLMVSHDAKKQMASQIENANKRLAAIFNEIHSADAVDIDDIKRILHAIDEALLILYDMSQTSHFLFNNPDCYNDIMLEKISDDRKRELFNTLKSFWQEDNFVACITDGRLVDSLKEYEYDRYIVFKYIGYKEYYVFSTGKFEKDLLTGKPINDYDKSDSIKNFELWKNRFQKPRVLCDQSFGIYALTDRGEILTNKQFVYNGKLDNHNAYPVISAWHDVIRMPQEMSNYYALTYKGEIRYGGLDKQPSSGLMVSEGETLSGVKSFCAYYDTVVALYNDGTTKITTRNGNTPDWGIAVNNWKDIIKIDMHQNLVAGLTSKGEVLLAAEDIDKIPSIYKRWKDVVDIKAFFNGVGAITSAREVLSTGYVPDGCNNAFRLVNLGAHLGVVTVDGHVAWCWEEKYRFKSEKPECAVWKNAVDFQGEYLGIFAILKDDGTVFVSDRTYNVSGWENIVEILLMGRQLFGVTKEGKVLCAGEDEYGLFDEVRTWKLFDDYDATFNFQTMKANIVKNLAAEKEKKKDLITEKQKLQSEIDNLKGLFTAKKKANLEDAIKTIDEELAELDTEE